MNEYFKDNLDNGLRVVSIEMPHLHSAEMACFVNVGGRNEPADLAGISHFLEHIVFRGTREYPSSFQLERAFEAIGGSVNASTDAENTCFHSRLHPGHLGEGAQLFASMLMRPLFSNVDLERKIILEEALEDFNERGEEISPDNLTARLLWPEHPLSQPTIGTRETIARIGSEQLRAHQQRYYTPGNTVIAVAGRIHREAVLQAVQNAFDSWQGGAPPAPRLVSEQPPATPAISWVKDSDSQVNLQLAFRVPGRGDRRCVPLRVLRWVLSWGGTSRLMLRLRENLGLTYNVEANLSLFADCGCFTVDMAVAPENLVRAVEETLVVLEELRQDPVGAEDLAGVIKAYLYDLDFSRDHTDAMTTRYGWGEMAGYLRTIEQDRREVLAVTPQLLLETARELFVPQALKAAIVGPWNTRQRQAVEKALQGFGQ
ncbi:peptidase M16 [Desulfuromonas versatilis]|uniref:Peptidase M16 n=1 Tax=Desulfuromonas versatilis TaxID=2802975 RepID=A0ABM8HS83_9BACT|nr:pitrilysin family protein [Desulfuromonas versatilis]BCR03492.1 peptidase M16 [Desulfuromonas versatilis]